VFAAVGPCGRRPAARRPPRRGDVGPRHGGPPCPALAPDDYGRPLWAGGPRQAWRACGRSRPRDRASVGARPDRPVAQQL